MGVSEDFKKATGMSVFAFSKKIGILQGEVWRQLKQGYCSWPRIPKDGRKSHHLFARYNGMIRRCHDSGFKGGYDRYGARGIEDCAL